MLEDALGETHRMLVVQHSFHQDAKAVTADPRHHVPSRHQLSQPPADHAQHVVACALPEGVVD